MTKPIIVTGRVYFIQCMVTKRVKIGFTAGSCEKRANAIQQGAPTKLCLLGSVKGDRRLEAALHKRAESARVRMKGSREWFEYGGVIREILKEFAVRDFATDVDHYPHDDSLIFPRSRRFITIQEATRYVGLSRSTILKLEAQKQFPSRCCLGGNRIFFSLADLDKWERSAA